MAICEQQLGDMHPSTAASLNNLAGLYRAQGKYVEAEPLFQRALAICEQYLSPVHPSTAHFVWRNESKHLQIARRRIGSLQMVPEMSYGWLI